MNQFQKAREARRAKNLEYAKSIFQEVTSKFSERFWGCATSDSDISLSFDGGNYSHSAKKIKLQFYHPTSYKKVWKSFNLTFDLERDKKIFLQKHQELAITKSELEKTAKANRIKSDLRRETVKELQEHFSNLAPNRRYDMDISSASAKIRLTHEELEKVLLMLGDR